MPGDTLEDLRLAFVAAYLLGARDEAATRGAYEPLTTEADAAEAWQVQLDMAREPIERDEP